MAAGTEMESTGILQYADSAITAGKTRGLLSVFTDVSSAVPNSGGKMYPYDFGGTASFGYNINSGAYAGGYYINRNNSVGETAWSNINSSGGIFTMDSYYNYIHWPKDNRFVTIWDNNSNPQDDMEFVVLCDGITALDDLVLAGTIYDPSTGAPYDIGSATGSAGAFSVGTINTGWNMRINLTNLTQMQPTNVKYQITDYNNGYIYASGVITLDPSTSWFGAFQWNQDYPSIANIVLQSL